MYVTIDPYYDIQFYNESKEALKNNEIEFSEFISIKSPFNWYFKLDREPVLVNYDKLPEKDSRWLVSKVKPLRPNEEYILLRRNNDKGQHALDKFVNNDAMKEAQDSNFAVFFTVRNREELEYITKEIPVKIWYFGKYYANKYRVCLCTNKYIKNYLNPEQILLEKSKEHSEIGRFEAELNFRVFRGNDMLVKFTEMPYFENGIYERPRIKGDNTVNQSKFNI